MAGQVNYNIPGPIDVPQETNSGLDLLPTNTTMLVLSLRGESGSRRPEEIPPEHAKSTEAVMEYLQPKVTVKMQTGNPDRPEVEETIRFKEGVTAFNPKTIKRTSPTLRKLQAEFNSSSVLIDNIDKRVQFRKAMDDADARKAAIVKLKDIIARLEQSIPEPLDD